MHRTQNKSINTYPEPKSKLQEHKNFHMQSFTNHPNSNLRHLENRLYGCIAHDEYYIVCSWSKMRRSKNWWWWLKVVGGLEIGRRENLEEEEEEEEEEKEE